MSKREEVWGYIHNCHNYDPCPLCYGCRNFGIYLDCYDHCGDDKKKNVCNNKKLHNPKNFAKMINRPVINLD